MGCGGRPSMRSPRKRMRPPVGLRTPVMRLKRVVFPAPLGPIRPVIVPALISKEQWSRAITSPNFFTTSSIRNMGSILYLSTPRQYPFFFHPTQEALRKKEDQPHQDGSKNGHI